MSVQTDKQLFFISEYIQVTWNTQFDYSLLTTRSILALSPLLVMWALAFSAIRIGFVQLWLCSRTLWFYLWDYYLNDATSHMRLLYYLAGVDNYLQVPGITNILL
jgi:hypothetical protein